MFLYMIYWTLENESKRWWYGRKEAKYLQRIYACTKKANEKYNAKFHEVKVRMSPERHEMLEKYAQDKGESTSAFINRAIDEAIERDNQ